MDKWESGGDLLGDWDVDNSVDKWIRSEVGIRAGFGAFILQLVSKKTTYRSICNNRLFLWF